MRARLVIGFRASWSILFGLLVWAMAGHAAAGDYAEARADLVAAYQAGNYPAMRAAAQRALDARPGYPAALFNRALAELLDGAATEALQTLQSLLDQGIDPGVGNTPEFEALRSLPGWADYVESARRLEEPAGHAEVAFTLDVGDFVPEGIAIDAIGRLYLGSVRHGSIVRLGNRAEYLATAGRHFAVFGMRLDGHGGLWFASANVPEFRGPQSSLGPRTGLYRLDLDTHAVRGTELPGSDEARVLGDLVLAGEDTLLATESLTGALYRYDIARGEFSAILPPGTLGSAQGLVMDAGGDYLYLADYVGGLFRLNMQDTTLDQLASDTPSALFGIDGLYRYGNDLIAIQNGIRPNRIVALHLSADGLSVEGITTLARNLPEFDEPTLGQVVGDNFYFVANSHWNRFDREGNLPEGLQGPVVMRLSLRR